MSDAIDSARELGAPIRRLVEQVRAEEADVYRHDPTEGSEARQELNNTEVRGDGSRWGPDPVAEAQGMPGVRLFAADDHLNALSELVGSRHSVLGWAVACRNVLDASARAWWLLEPGVGARRRVARYFADWYQSVQFRGPLLSGLGGDSEPERPERVLNDARKLGLEVIHTNQGFHFEDEQVPHPAALVHDLLDDAGFDAGEGFYRYLSGTTHGDRQAILDVLQAKRNDDGARGPQIDRVRLVVQITLTGYTAAVLRSWGYNGWDRGRVRDLLKRALDATNA